MKKNNRENLVGVTPEEFKKAFIIHKSSKKGQSSFRITKDLLESILSTSSKIQKTPTLIITITDGSNEYIISSSITKTKAV
jgi:hypothetical protein